MNPFFTVFLFSVSLLAIAGAFSLLLFIANELRHGSKTDDSGEPTLDGRSGKSQEVARLLGRMRAATFVKLPGEKKRIDSDSDKN